MSYVDDNIYALVRVLDHAALHKDLRLAGYAANLDFWIEEIQQKIDCLAGYNTRHEKLVAARESYAKQHNLELDAAHLVKNTTDDELRKLKERLISSSKRFLKLCCEQQYIDHAKQKELEAYLGIRINYPRSMD